MPSLEDITPEHSKARAVSRGGEKGNSDTIESPSVESGQKGQKSKLMKTVAPNKRKWT